MAGPARSSSCSTPSARSPTRPPTAASAEDAFHLVLPSLPGYGFSGEPTELGWESGRIAQAWAELMDRLGYTRYVAQGATSAPPSRTRWAAKVPTGLRGIHVNLLATALGHRRSAAGGVRAGTRGARRARDVHDGRLRLLPGAVHPAADDRLLLAGFTRRAGGLDARPRHGQLLQDLPCICRRRARRQPHPGQHPRQHHAVLADRHRRLGRPVVLGIRTVPRARAAGHAPRRSRFLSASQRSRAKSGLPRGAGSRRSTPASPTSTRSTGAATSPPGRSRSSSQLRCGRHSAHYVAAHGRLPCTAATRLAQRGALPTLLRRRRPDSRARWQNSRWVHRRASPSGVGQGAVHATHGNGRAVHDQSRDGLAQRLLNSASNRLCWRNYAVDIDRAPAYSRAAGHPPGCCSGHLRC